jgi:carbon storage regulator CsrA
VLILSRKAGETIVVGDNITITINRVASNRVSLGIAAPADVRITRGELKPLPSEPAAEHHHEADEALVGKACCDVAAYTRPRINPQRWPR